MLYTRIYFMRLYNLVFSLGILNALVPFAGFPRSLDTTLTVVVGSLLMVTALGMRVQYRAVFAAALGRDRRSDADAAFVENGHPPRRKRSAAGDNPVRHVAVASVASPAPLSAE